MWLVEVQLLKGINFSNNLSLGCLIAHWKGLNEKNTFHSSRIPSVMFGLWGQQKHCLEPQMILKVLNMEICKKCQNGKIVLS